MEMHDALTVRMLLRVSSKQQLDADGDLPTQRRIVAGYIETQEDWKLDPVKPEYHEFGVSGYKNAVADREVLQQILADARQREFQILVCYKDDRLGRREDEIPAYIRELADLGVWVYTVKEGCITPQSHVDHLMTFIRYWSAQGDSMKTAQRVKDAAMEQVRMGKNQGGRAPFGYRLELSGELSKHQRALKKKVIVPEEADLVKKIFDYALTYGYGAYKIAKILNSAPRYRKMARNGIWKAGTVSDMLKNPVYTGYEAYNRRAHEGDRFCRMRREDWILSEKCHEETKIIDWEDWEKVQNMRENRKKYFQGKATAGETVSTTGMLPFLDVMYCGYCGRKLTNGSKYNYWTTKDQMKKKSVVQYYRCQARQQGEPCEGRTLIRADEVEPVICAWIRRYLTQIEDNDGILEAYRKRQRDRKRSGRRRLEDLQRRLRACQMNCEVYRDNLPKVLRGDMPIPTEDYYSLIQREREREMALQCEIRQWTEDCRAEGTGAECDRVVIPSWGEAFDGADPAVKRRLINRLIKKVEVWDDKVIITVSVNLGHLAGGEPFYP